ncbi:MAG TPA: thiol:disulfide interchange protein DsbA/DsbL [Steroidobacteraceae bacterium]|jgi:thiol:disulfide interchange protein DsbA|nr:thiol:disulfide interchange protein DsbA/DsbL [Steroidobacteraceae bacterium]
MKGLKYAALAMLAAAGFWAVGRACAAQSAPPAAGAAAPAGNWTEGVNYFLIRPARPTGLPAGKVEVTEVFSYACPACNLFVPTMHKLQTSLPPNAVMDFLPASFNPAEDWPMFQLAYFTAQALGVADRCHDAMFKAVWQTGELAVIDPGTRNIKSRLPTIEDAAQFYKKQAGVPVDKFLATAKSFSVDMKVRQGDALLAAYAIDRTPTIVVNGKYRLHVESAGSEDKLVELVKWLVAKESR